MAETSARQWSVTAADGVAPTSRKRHGRGTLHQYLIALTAVIALVTMTAVSSGNGVAQAAAAPALNQAAMCEDTEREPQEKPESPTIGDPVRDGKFEFTVTKVVPGVEEIGGDYGDKAQGQFILVCINVENIGDESQLFDGSAQKLFDAEDREFSADTAAAIYLEESESFLNEINPGNKVEGIVVFDVPKNVEPVKIELHDSVFSGGVTVNLARS
ncbi:DUF4352 domain-containing protein [Streptomyces chryseus]